MTPLVAGLLGAAIAALVAAGAWLVARGIRNSATPEAHDDVEGVNHVGHIIDSLPSGGALVGPHDDLLKHNEEAVGLGVVRGTRLAIPELLALVRHCRTSQEPYSGPLTYERIPGTYGPELMVYVIPFVDERVFVMAEDIGESQRVESVRRDFVTNISHELKTPIGAIGILAEAVEAASDDPVEVARFAQRLQKESARLAELVKQIIELSRLQAEDLESTRDVVDVVEVANEALSRSRETAESRNVTLLKNYTLNGRQFVLGDHWQLSDAVANLVTNAIAYSDRNARVSVMLQNAHEGDDEYIDIKVSDNGIGISPEDQERIFERFYRVDYGRSRESGGTGLGLSIVRHIVNSHGGTITVWSKPGQGSTFTIRVPAYLGPTDDTDMTEEE